MQHTALILEKAPPSGNVSIDDTKWDFYDYKVRVTRPAFSLLIVQEEIPPSIPGIRVNIPGTAQHRN